MEGTTAYITRTMTTELETLHREWYHVYKTNFELRQEIDASQQQFIEYQKLIDWNKKTLEWFIQTEAAFAKAAPKL